MMREAASRRLGGLLVLVMGLLAALLVPRVLDAGVAGVASRAPAPGPPAIGSCVLWPGYEVVDCEAPHTAEVVQTWEATDLDRTRTHLDCAADLASYLGLRPADISPGWFLPSTEFVDSQGFSPLRTVLLEAPPAERLGGPGWLACAVGTEDPPRTVTGRLAELVTPAGVGACFAELGTPENIQSQIACTDDHHMELLGSLTLITGTNDQLRWGSITVSEFPGESLLHNECLLIAEQLLRTPDPTFGGRVQIEVDYRVERADFSGDDDAAMMLYASCYALTAADQVLTDSLVGIAQAPLPVR